MRAAVVYLSGFCATTASQVPFDDESSLCLLQKAAAVKPVWHSVDLSPAPEHFADLKAVQKNSASSLALASIDAKPAASAAIKAEWHSVDLNPAPKHTMSAKATAVEKSLSEGREAALEEMSLSSAPGHMSTTATTVKKPLSDDRETALEKMSLSSIPGHMSAAATAVQKSLSDGREAALEEMSLSSASAAVGSQSLASGFADLNTENAAESAALSEDGYSAVAALGNRELMRAYVRRVAKDEGLRIINEGSLSGALAYYTGECSTQSYAALVRELWRGTETAKCKQAWVQPVKASSLLQTSSHPNKAHVATSSSTDQEEPDNTWRWAADLEDSLGVLQAELMNLKAAVLENEERDLAELKTKEAEGRDSIQKNNQVERNISLNQEGYEQLAAKGNTTEMAFFVRLVAEHEGFKVKNVKPLEGMSRYYSGECATQSFEALKNELHRVAGRSNSRCGGGPWLIKQ